jgi:hypothetical protein
MFWNKKKTVRVVFVDASTGAAFAHADSPPEQLPESFEAHTTVNVQGQECEVLSAVPVTRAECVKAGEPDSPLVTAWLATECRPAQKHWQRRSLGALGRLALEVRSHPAGDV